MPCAPLEPQEDIDKEVKPQEYIDKEVADALLAANAAPTRTYLTKEGKGFVDEHLAEWIRRGADGVKGSRDAFISDILSEAALRGRRAQFKGVDQQDRLSPLAQRGDEVPQESTNALSNFEAFPLSAAEK